MYVYYTRCYHQLFIGLYDYSSSKNDKLSFKKGDLLYIIKKQAFWWYARLKHTGQQGYIPYNYVTECKSLEE